MLDQKLSLEILKATTRIASSTPHLGQILSQIIDVVKNKMEIDACSIFLIDDAEKVSLQASSGYGDAGMANLSLNMGQGVTGWVARHKRTLALREAMQDPRFVYIPETVEEQFQSMLSVPILREDHCIGVVNAHTRDKRYFSPMEIVVLETIADQVAGSISNALIYSKNQMMIKELSILYDVSLAAQSTLNPELGLWVILSGITRGEAGGFNRAILFAVEGEELIGTMGLGPDSPEDAQRIWTDLGGEGKEYQIPQRVVSEEEKDEYSKSNFNKFAKTLRYPLKKNDNVLAEAALKRKIVHVENGEDHSLISEKFRQTFGVDSFAAVPLTAHEEVLGVILVDNRYNAKPITETSLHLLARFAAHAGWVLENSRLITKLVATNRELLSMKDQLIENEKLTVLGQLSAEVAHEIKNPLVSIGGFARRLRDKILPAPNPSLNHQDESVFNYANIILKETQRLERLLEDILTYPKTGDLNLETCNPGDLIAESLDTFQSVLQGQDVTIETCIQKDLDTVLIDPIKIKQVINNILSNALESMPHEGKIRISVYRVDEAEESPALSIRIEDSGGGIPDHALDNIFNPFFTTKKTGTGLGLSICRKIVENHGGTLRVENFKNKGVEVCILLPLKNSRDCTKKEYPSDGRPEKFAGDEI